MADDLTNLWESFSLIEEEDIEFAIPKTRVSRGNACVLGKLISDRLVSCETIRSTLVPIWKIINPLSFTVLGDNFFLIDFSDPLDKERVLAGKPWVWEGNLFLVEDFDGITPPLQFSFDKAAFWVRMINMPLTCMCREIGQKIEASTGTVEHVDMDAEGIG